jgi:predicted RND superfamily exporter protein
MNLATIFGRAATFSVRRPRRVLAAAALAVLAALALAAGRLTLHTSNLDLVDPDLEPVRRFRELAAELGTPNVLVAVFEGDDENRLRAAVDRAGPLLRPLPGVRSVVDRLPFEPAALDILGVDPYLGSRDGGLLFIFIQPDDPHSAADTIAPFVTGAREALAAVEGDGVRVGLTGMPAYALDDRDVIRRDITVLSAISLLLIGALFVTAFGSWRRPLAAVAALLAAVCATLGAAAVHPGHLTLLSAFFASILFGLGIDYGIHVIDRVEELVAEGLDERRAVPAAVAALAPGLATGAATTASVFFAMQLSGFRGFAELGVIAGAGVLACLVAAVTVLPALLAVAGARPGRERRLGERRLGRVLRAVHSRPLAWLLAAAAAAGLFAGSPPFDTDYLDLQPKGSETVRLEREMVRRSDWSPVFAAFLADSMDEVKDLTWELVNDDTVGAVRSLRDFELFPFFPGALPQLSAAFRSRFVGPSGRYAVYAYPRGDVWDPEEQEAFISHMRSIDPGVTGMPFLGSFMVERSRHALRVTAVLGSLLLLLWVGLDFRDLRWTLLAVLPAFLTMTSTLALMRLLGLAFNPLNVMALPVVLGISVDDGVHIVHRFRAEAGDLARTLAGTGRSVVLTSATTLAAFGTLAFTSHRGLASFAFVLILGVSAALVLSVVVLPELLRRFSPSRAAEPAGGRSSEPLDDRRDAHAAADAEGHEAGPPVAALELVEEGAEEHRAGRPQGMTEGDGAAVDVDPFGVEIEVPHRL